MFRLTYGLKAIYLERGSVLGTANPGLLWGLIGCGEAGGLVSYQRSYAGEGKALSKGVSGSERRGDLTRRASAED
jgi:hypothetical protein